MRKITLVFLLAVVALTALPRPVMAQPANLMAMAQAELQKRGLDEGAVRARLLENGIDVDNIPPQEYPAYQSRVTAILNQMQAEKAGNAAAVGEAAAETGGAAIATVVPATEVAPDEAKVSATTADEAAAEAEAARKSTVAEATQEPGGDIYGHALFTGRSLDVFRTTDGAQAPDTYILGEGDEVHISIFGSSQTEMQQRIGPDGSIQPAGSTKIFLKGMTLAQARDAVRNKLSQHFSFRPDQIAVTITTARTVQVSLYGEVNVQGGFTMSALNTTFNAIAAAGGPSPIGSVRNIQMSRSGKTYRLDLYQFMMHPEVNMNYDLQNGDVFFVPVAQKVVRIEGAVNRPMRYELVEGETLTDLIRYAGGLTYNAYPNFVQIERQQDGEVKLLEYDLSSVMNGKVVSLQAGDVVRLKASNQPIENYVAVSGDVYYEGRYDLAKNRSLKALLDQAKPKYTAKTDIVFVERTRPDNSVEVLTVPFPGINGNPDFSLQERDAVRVLSQENYRDLATITVAGQIRRPFTRDFNMNDRMTIGQALEYAGGLKPSVYPVAYIFRKDLSNPSKMQYLQVSLDRDKDKYLQPGDSLKIFDNTTYTNIGEVSVSGAVKEPVRITYDSSITVHDLLSMAGGFEVGAAYNRVEVFRVNISKTNEVEYKLMTLTVDDNYFPVGGDFQIQPFDRFVVRRTPNFSTGRSVEVNGRVAYPGEYVLEDGKTHLSEIVEKAGGMLDDATPYAVLIRTYRSRGPISVNLKEMKRHRRNIEYDPILMEGDVVDINRLENTVIIRPTGTRMDQYVPDDLLSDQKTLTFKGRRNAAWYIRHNAGGFQRNADKNSVTVTLPNNECESVRRFLWIRNYPEVEPGSIVTLSMNPEKVRKEAEPKEKVDLESTLSKALSSIMSVVSILLLATRL